jgi:hypothetical protein
MQLKPVESMGAGNRLSAYSTAAMSNNPGLNRTKIYKGIILILSGFDVKYRPARLELRH